MAAKSASARYYASHPAAAKRKSQYDVQHNKSKAATAKRVALNKYNRHQTKLGNNKVGDGTDASHKGKRIVGYSSQSRNRGDKNNSVGDRNARSKHRFGRR